MTQTEIRHIIERRIAEGRPDAMGMVETPIPGVRLFRVTEAVRCAPAVYEPSVVAIVGGTKEAILDGQRYRYGRDRYLCCPIAMPVEAGTPEASAGDPLLGVQVMLDARMMGDLVIEIERASGSIRRPGGGAPPHGLTLARWDEAFADALTRLVRLVDNPTDAAVLGEGRLRELLHAVLKGEAGPAARRAFGVGNEIARAIDHLASNLNEPVTIEGMAARVGMSRAVFHRRFKEATTLSPIQFAKAMRLNEAAMRIAGGTRVSEAAMEVGYTSPSQFSREFKRMYGHSPKEWWGTRIATAA